MFAFTGLPNQGTTYPLLLRLAYADIVQKDFSTPTGMFWGSLLYRRGISTTSKVEIARVTDGSHLLFKHLTRGI